MLDGVDRRRRRDVVARLQVARGDGQPVERDQLLPRVGLGEATAHLCASSRHRPIAMQQPTGRVVVGVGAGFPVPCSLGRGAYGLACRRRPV